MNAHRTHQSRMIPYDAPNLRFDGAAALRRAIVHFVAGIKGPRVNPVTEKQILLWFRSTDPEFVKARITEVVTAGDVEILRRGLSSTRRANGGYVYQVAA